MKIKYLSIKTSTVFTQEIITITIPAQNQFNFQEEPWKNRVKLNTNAQWPLYSNNESHKSSKHQNMKNKPKNNEDEFKIQPTKFQKQISAKNSIWRPQDCDWSEWHQIYNNSWTAVLTWNLSPSSLLRTGLDCTACGLDCWPLGVWLATPDDDTLVPLPPLFTDDVESLEEKRLIFPSLNEKATSG